MILHSSDFQTLCQTAKTAVQKAGELINSYVDKDITVNNKEAADSLASQVVTEVDIKAQDIILEILSPSLLKYDLALLTEESTDDKSRFEKDYFWCIDPMDGTLAFTEKTPGYSVSIALVSKKGEAVIGVVYDPLTQNLYHAIREKGAYKNGNKWSPDFQRNNTTTFHLYMDRSFENHPFFQPIMSNIKGKLLQEGYSEIKIETAAGAVLNACWVMDNAPACYFKLPKPEKGGGSIWDFAATAIIVKEGGAYGKSFWGSNLELNRADSTFMNHKGALYASSKKIAALIQEAVSEILP